MYVCFLTAPSIVKRFWKIFFRMKGYSVVMVLFTKPGNDEGTPWILRKIRSLMICLYTFTDFSVNNYGKIRSDYNFLNFKTILKFVSYIWEYRPYNYMQIFPLDNFVSTSNSKPNGKNTRKTFYYLLLELSAMSNT